MCNWEDGGGHSAVTFREMLLNVLNFGRFLSWALSCDILLWGWHYLKRNCVNYASMTLDTVKLLTEGLPGIHQRFIPKKRFVCSRESTKRFLRFSLKWSQKTLVSKLHIYHHCSENVMRFWHLLVKNLKTWWKLSGNLVNFQNLMKDKVKKPGGFTKFFLGENLVKFENLVKTWWIHHFFFGEHLVIFENLVNSPGFFLWENLVKFENLVNSPSFFWWKLGEIWKLGENLVNSPSFFCEKTWWNLKTWWKPGEFTSFFWWKLGEIWKPGEFTKFFFWWKLGEI